jgi:branched-chain amino acid transport system ATP-binding protein
MLAIGRALMFEPRLLLIDELSLGLMPRMVDLCFEALEIADTVCILASGSTVFFGPAATARADTALFESFISPSRQDGSLSS